MIDIKVEEILNVKDYVHLDVFVFNLPLEVGFCKAKFKLSITQGVAGLEFRDGNGWPQMFVNWPGQSEDAYGRIFRLTTGKQLPDTIGLLGDYDRQFLACLVDSLAEIVEAAIRKSGCAVEVALSLAAAAGAFHAAFKAAVVPPGVSPPANRPHPDSAPGEAAEVLIRAQIAITRPPAAAVPPAAADPAGGRGDHPPPAWVELGQTNIFLACENPAGYSAVTVEGAGEAIRLIFPAVPAGIRLLSPLHQAGHLLHRPLATVEVHLRAVAAPATAALIGIGYVDQQGEFRLAHAFCRNHPLTVADGPLKFAVTRSGLRKALRGAGTDRPVFLVAGFDAAATIEVAPPTWLDDDPAALDIPYRRSEQTHCARLLMLNSELAYAGPRDRLRWLVSEAELAYRFECLETASSLLRLIAPHHRRLEPGQRRRFLSLWVELGFAEGRRAEVGDLLVSNYDLARIDDHLFTALSLCLPPDQAGEMFDRLPSGKPNRAWLSRHPVAAKALALLAEAEIEDADGQTRLLAAGQLRGFSPGLYLTAFNDLLGRHDLAPLTAAGGENGLADFRFSAVEKQPAGPKISVIMAVHNAAATVSQAIRSILEQSHQPVELLVCDDCSTDTSAQEIAAWRHDERVRIYRSVEHQGPYNIRNNLIAEASGAYVTFQDADDLSHPQRLHRQLQLLEGGAAAVFGHWIRIRPDGTVVFFRDHRCQRMSVVSLMARRELFGAHGGYRNVLCGADTDFLERIRLQLEPDAVIELEQPLVLALWSPQSLTRQPGLEATEDGYRSPARRRFAEIAGRQRLLGRGIVPDSVVEQAVQEVGLYRPGKGVIADPATGRQ